jgi:hypothetical protein
MKKLIQLLTILSLVACQDSALDPNDPTAVARAFWNATLAQNEAAVSSLSVDPNVPLMIYTQKEDSGVVYLSEVVRQQGYYFISTDVQLVRNNKRMTFPLKTLVVHTDDGFKVDAWSTQQSAVSSVVEESLSVLERGVANAAIAMDISSQFEEAGEIDKQLDRVLADIKQKLLNNYKTQANQGAR